MTKKTKNKLLTDILNKVIDEMDDETGRKRAEEVIRNIVKVASGKTGGAREAMTAAALIFERIDGKVKEEVKTADLLDAYPDAEKRSLAEKYAKGGGGDVEEKITRQ